MVSITLKLIVLKKFANILTLLFLFFFVQLLPKPFFYWSISFLVIYKLFCLVFGLSDGLLTFLLNFVF